jgi:hypothetical protein
VFGRRSRKIEEEAAREAERRALFEELAKRPDSICPFLGLAQARTEYHDGVNDEHRCYAFGDPAELSSEQQRKVCLQRGYGNCPRYLRGVLVIPTEELEALRRPTPRIERPAPAPVAAPKPARRPVSRGLVTALGVLLLLAAGGGAAFWYLGSQVESSVAAATLPAGTDFGAELISLSAPDGGTQRLRATASIGDTEAVPSTTLIYVFDLSGSTLESDGCGGDQNGDGLPGTALDCEIAAAAALNAQAIASGTVGEVGLVGFASTATSADLAPADGAQALIGPDVDDDGDGTPNVIEAMQSAFSAARRQPAGFTVHTETSVENRTTDFSAGIAATCDILAQTENPNRLVVFLSDGSNRGGAEVASVLPCSQPAVFQTFAAGIQASCLDTSPLGGLAVIADLTEGTCTTVSNLEQLPQILEAVVAPQLTRVELSIDGADPIDITESAAESMPRTGPASISIDHPIPALGDGSHELCVTVHASDAGGTGSVTSCSPVGSGGGRLTSSD